MSIKLIIKIGFSSELICLTLYKSGCFNYQSICLHSIQEICDYIKCFVNSNKSTINEFFIKFYSLEYERFIKTHHYDYNIKNFVENKKEIDQPLFTINIENSINLSSPKSNDNNYFDTIPIYEPEIINLIPDNIKYFDYLNFSITDFYNSCGLDIYGKLSEKSNIRRKITVANCIIRHTDENFMPDIVTFSICDCKFLR